jgi:hypothetical protein
MPSILEQQRFLFSALPTANIVNNVMYISLHYSDIEMTLVCNLGLKLY